MHAEVDAATLHALTGDAARGEPAAHRELTVSPDVLTGLLAKLGGAGGPGARRESRAAGGARPPHHRVRGAAGPARHARAGRLLPAPAGPGHRGGGRAAPADAAGAGRGGGRGAADLASGPGGAGGPGPVPVRARGRGGRGRAGRAGGQRREVPAGQPVVGINTDPGRNPGVLVRHRPDGAAAALLRAATAGGSAPTS